MPTDSWTTPRQDAVPAVGPWVDGDQPVDQSTGAGATLSTVAWIFLGLIGAIGFATLTWLVASGSVIPFDQPLLDLGRSWTQYTGEWQALSDAANIPLIVIGVGLVVLLFAIHRRREAILVVLVLAAVTAGSEAVKQLVARPRPPGTDTVVPGVVYSFPSGHVLEAATIFGIIAILLWRSSIPMWIKAGFAIGATAFVVMVATARVAINAHYPSDVLAGLLGGIAVVAAFALLSRGRAEPAP